MATCPACESDELEKRGSRRCYFPLGEDGWDEGEIEMDTWKSDGAEIIYCTACDGEWRAEELGEQ